MHNYQLTVVKFICLSNSLSVLSSTSVVVGLIFTMRFWTVEFLSQLR